MSVLEVKNLTIQYRWRRRVLTAVDDVSFHLEHGQILGIVGESGAGKSTLANGLIGLVDQPARVASGEVLLNGRLLDIRDETSMRRIRGRHIGIIVQDTLNSLNPLRTVERHLTETISEHLGLNSRQAFGKALDVLRQVGVPEPEVRISHFPHQFSGGMRQRLVVALAICAEPDVIIADEPTTNLDALKKRHILDLITKLCRRRQVGLILITHDVGLIAGIADRMIVMFRGRVVEAGTTGEVLGRPLETCTRNLICSVPPAHLKLHRFPVVGPAANELCRDSRADMAKAWLTSRGKFQRVSGPLIELNHVEMTFVIRRSWLRSGRRYVRAISDVSLQIMFGEVFGLVGESGSGKSTLARLISGLQTPVSGRIRFAGRDLQKALSSGCAGRLRHEIQMIFQDPYSSLNGRMRIIDILAEPIRLYGLAPSRGHTRDLVCGLLDYVGLGAEAAERYPHQFSAGQRQRIAIARALATRPRVLICDEPTSALDVATQALVLNLLKDLQEDLGLTVLFISHDLAVIRQMCNRVGVMRDGALCEVADTEMLFEHPQHEYTRQLFSLLPSQNLSRPSSPGEQLLCNVECFWELSPQGEHIKQKAVEL